MRSSCTCIGQLLTYSFSFLFLCLFSLHLQAQVCVTGVMYNTPSFDDEWIEICNNGTTSADISGFILQYGSGPSTFTFPASTMLAAGACTVVAVGDDGQGDPYNDGASGGCTFTPPFVATGVTIGGTSATNALNNTSGTITLLDAVSTVVNTIMYDDGTGADGNGDALAFDCAGVASVNTGGCATITTVGCAISSVAANTVTCSGSDATFNVTFNASDASGDYNIIDAGGATIGALTGAAMTATSLSATATITGPTTAGNIMVNIVDANDPTCLGTAVTVAIPTCPAAPTPDICITGVMYNTPSTDDEWIEICNTGTASVNISGYMLQYGSGPSTFTFPVSTMLAAGACTVVAVGDDGQSDAFNDGAAGGCTFTPPFVATGVTIGGTSTTNALNNGSGTIILLDAASTVVSTIMYDDGTGADGNGDALAFDCAGTASVNTGGCPTGIAPVCAISNVTAGVASCSTNDATFTITFDAANASGDYNITDAGAATIGSLTGAAMTATGLSATATITGPTTAGNIMVNVVDANDPTCLGTAVTVAIPTCPTPVCAISNIVAGTVSCSTNDATFTITFDAANASGNYNITDAGGATIGSLTGAAMTATGLSATATITGPTTAGNIMVNVVDANDPTCLGTAIAVAIPTCPTPVCAISNIVAGTVSCSTNDATFTITFDAANASGDYNITDAGGATIGSLTGAAMTATGLSATATITGPTTAGNIMVNVVDANDAACLGTAVTVAIPTCPTPVCAISNIVAGTVSCSTNDATFTITFDAANASGDYNITDAGGATIGSLTGAAMTANGLSATATITGPTTAGNIMVNVVDANDPTCLGTAIAVAIPTCPTPVCAISNIVAGTVSCSTNDATFTITFDAANASGDYNITDAGGATIGSLTGAAMTANGLSATATITGPTTAGNIMVNVVDANDPTCLGTAIAVAIPTCPTPVCAISNIVAGTVSCSTNDATFTITFDAANASGDYNITDAGGATIGSLTGAAMTATGLSATATITGPTTAGNIMVNVVDANDPTCLGTAIAVAIPTCPTPVCAISNILAGTVSCSTNDATFTITFDAANASGDYNITDAGGATIGSLTGAAMTATGLSATATITGPTTAGNIMINVVDANDPTCLGTAIAVAIPTCPTPVCAISNILAGTVSCSTNDATFTITFDAANGSGDYNITDAGGATIGSLTGAAMTATGLSATATITGPTTAGNIMVNVVDANDPTCLGTAIAVAIPTCPTPVCAISNILAGTVSCSTNDATFTITFDAANASGNYNITDAGGATIGSLTGAAMTATGLSATATITGPTTAGNIMVNVVDANDPTCLGTAIAVAIPTCPTPVCAISNILAGTVSCSTNDATFTITFDAANASGDYNITDAGGATIGSLTGAAMTATGLSATATITGPTTAGNIMVNVVDANDPTCLGTAIAVAIPTCPTPVCAISNILAGTVSCSTNDATFTITFDAANASGDYNITDAGGATIGSLTGAAMTATGLSATATITGPTTAGNIMVNVVDANDAACLGTAVTVAIPTCPTPVCAISNIVAGTVSCSTNDATFTITFDAANGSGDYNITDAGGATIGSLTGAAMTATGLSATATITGPTTAGNIMVNVVDANDPTCLGTAIAVAIPTCPTPVCAISNILAGTVSCSTNDATFTITFDAANGSGDYNITDAGGATIGSLTGAAMTATGLSATATITGPTTAGNIMVNVVDANDPTCLGTAIAVAIPTCPTPVCAISNIVAGTVSCSTNDATFTITFDAANASGDYNITDAGGATIGSLTGAAMTATGLSATATITGPTTAGNIMVNVVDANDPTCLGTAIAVAIPTCPTPVCAISNIVAGTVSCSTNDATSTITFDAANGSGDYNITDAGGATIGSLTGAAMTANGLSATATITGPTTAGNIMVNVVDANDATCLGTAVTVAIPTCPTPLPALCITGVMYNTPSTDDEWIEICNTDAITVDISGYMLQYGSGPSTFTFPASTILAAGACTVVAVGDDGQSDAFNDGAAGGCTFTPPFVATGVTIGGTSTTNALNNGSGTITLLNPASTIVSTIMYDDATGADGNGDALAFDCLGAASVNTGGCPTGIAPVCAISNLTAGVAICSGDDATFTITFDAANASGDYNITDAGGATIGSLTGAAMTATGLSATATITGPTTPGNIMVNVVDANDPTCLGTAVTVAIPTCPTPVCAISNVLAGTATCSGDDATFTVTFDVANGSGDYNITDAGGATIGSLTGAATTATALSTTITITGPTSANTIMVNVVDANDAACLGTAVTVAIPTCPTPVCAISNVLAGTATCSGDDATFTVTFDVANGSGDYNIVDAGGATIGSLTGAAMTANGLSATATITGPTTAGNIMVNVVDANDPTCLGTAVTVAIPTCPTPVPALCITGVMYNTPSTDDEWIEICNTDAITVDISGYMLQYGSGPSTFTFPASTILAAGACTVVAVGDDGQSDAFNDGAAGGCTFTPPFVATGVTIGGTSTTNALNNGSGTITLLNPASTIVSTIMYDDATGADGNGDALAFDCLGAASVNTGGCPTGIAPVCAISNLTAGVAICSGDDATFTITFDAANASGDYNITDAGGATIGSLTGAAMTATGLSATATITGPTTAGNIMVNVVDANDPTCLGTAIAVAIPACPVLVCAISNIAATMATCSGDDATFDVTFDVNNGSGDYNIVDAGGVILASITGAATTATGLTNALTITGPTTANSIMVNVVDANDATCMGTAVTVAIPTCPVIICPTLAAVGTNPTSCGAADGFITLTTTDVPDGTYTINSAAGSFTGIFITGNTGTITGLGDGSYDDLTITANTCTSTEDVDVSLTSPNSISAVAATTTCNTDGSYCVDITFDATTPLNTDYTVTINGIDFGPFAFDAGTAQTQTALCDASFIGDMETGLTVTVTDGATGGGGGGNNFGPIFISELHYDNDGGDMMESVEITATAGTDLTGFTIVLYNGSNGTSYNTINATGILADAGSGCGALSFDVTGIQNGGPDGVALVDAAGVVVEFISYEGAFTATDGPANGMMSTDILVAEPGNTPVGESLQLTDAGWVGPMAASSNSINAGLSCPSTGAAAATCADNTTFDEPFCPLIVCGISNIAATTTCNPFGAYDLEICFDYENPLGANVVVLAGGQNMGIFPYPAASGDCILVTGIPSSSSQWSCDGEQGTLEIEVFDENTTFEGVPFISEIHYDNATSTDINEFIEITAGAGTDLSSYQLVAYDNDGAEDATVNLSGIVPDQGNGCGAIAFTLAELNSQFFENGPNEGRALVGPTGIVIDFISYEGTITATDGPAAGMTSTDILVSENGSTDGNSSLELSDAGWAVAATSSQGVLNANIASCLSPVCAATATVTEPECCPAPSEDCGSCTYYLYLHDALGNGWDGSRLMVSVNDAADVEYKLTVADGIAQYYPIEINDGGTIDIMYMNGANSVEHSYQLLDESGTIVFEDGALTDGNAPTASLTTRTKAVCPECCQEEDLFTIAITMGSVPEAMSWEIVDGFGERIAFANAGDYVGQTPGSVLTQSVVLQGCNDYRFTTYSALNTGWQGGAWEILSSDPTRGVMISDNTYLIADGPCMFSEETTSLFTLPCHTDCPVDETVLADDLANCAITTYTPSTISPFVCFPNSCHANNVTVTVEFPTAVGGSVSGPQATTTAALPIGSNPVVYESTYADGQIVRCTMTVHVIGDANPSLTCNDNVIISLPAAQSTIEECFVTVSPDMVLEDTGVCEDQFTVTVFDANGIAIGNQVGPDQAGQTWTYSIQQIGSTGNLCWGTLMIEDKYAPVIACQDYTIACNHPQALNENYTYNETFRPANDDLPANIAGGTATAPSETIIAIPSTCTPLGEIIQDVNVSIAIEHNDVEDLEIILLAPNGDQFTLLNYLTCVGLGVQNMVATFDSDVTNAPSCSFNLPGVSGTFAPVDDLRVLNGLAYADFQGDWQLIVRDNDASFGDGIGYGEVIDAQIRIQVGFPTPFNAFDCSLQGVSLLEEQITETSCDQSEWAGAKILRTWQAIDAFGNSATCLQTVNLQAPTLDQIEVPGDIQLECGQVADEPSLNDTGIPFYDCFDLTEDVHQLCDVSYTYEDQVLATCGLGKKIIRTWTVINWCAGVNHTFEQTIKIEDTTGPSINANNIIMSTDGTACSTSVIFDGAITDACSDIQQVFVTYTEGGGVYNQSGTLIIVDITNGESIDDLPLGFTDVVITAKDNCGNETVENLSINVVDTQAPVAICDDELHVSLGSDGTARLLATDVNEGSYDNCSNAISLAVRRTSGCLGTSAWGDEVTFSCCDNLVTVELRVTDEAGNSNICWKEVLVEDALPPVITCAPDKTLDCDDAAIHDPFTAPEAIDNCDASIIDVVDGGELDQCKAGTLTRTWTASDGSDKSADITCTQRVTVNHISDFIVQFPADVTLTNCAIQDSGAPSLSDDDCELIAISSEDLILDIVEDACFKIERTWTVINWCVYDEGNTANTDLGLPQPLPRTYQDDDGYFTYVQTIKVLDSGAPVIDCPGDQNFCDLTDGCEGQADLTLTATDACSPAAALEYTYKIDAFNDGSFDILAEGNDASGVYPYGTHRIKWIVEDGCGNTSDCSYLFTVEDCKNPTPVCLNGISIENMQTGCVDIWASDLLEYAFDNCSDATFVENSVRIRKEGDLASPQTAITLCCDDIGIVLVEIWVEDEAGNADYCTTYIDVQDNLNNCDDTGGDDSKFIAGKILTAEGTGVNEVTLNLHAGAITQTTTSDSNGAYAFTNPVALGDDYQVSAEKDTDPLNGVSTYDLVLMSQHILGLNSLDNPYALIAADVNNDGNITTFDVVQTRQLILYVIQDFPSNTSWRFIDKAYMFPNPSNPWQEAFSESVDFTGLNENQLATDFIGVKIGDVNGDVSQLKDTDERTGALKFQVEEQVLEVGQTNKIEFKAADFKQINGYQFTLNFDATALDLIHVEKGALNLTDANIGFTFLNEGMLTVSWNTTEAMTIADDTVLFSLDFKTNKALTTSQAFSISSRYTKAEAYQGNAIVNLDLDFIGSDELSTANGFELYQNTPNPFKGETTIGFNLTEAAKATLKVYDVTGKVLKVITNDFEAGYNQINLNSNQIQAHGVLYYQLDTPTDSATKKMIILE